MGYSLTAEDLATPQINERYEVPNTEGMPETWVSVYGPEIVRMYHCKPTFWKLIGWKSLYIRGRKAETIGKVELITYREYLLRKAARLNVTAESLGVFA